MNRSPTYPKYEKGDCGGYEFDPQVDFSQFLEEARKHAVEENVQVLSPYPEKAAKTKPREEKKSKKSWKSSLFSWWKVDKKSKPDMEPAKSQCTSEPRRGYTSGPIFRGGGQVEHGARHPKSGPLTSLFNTTKRAQNEIPYTNLDQLDPHGAQAYGPVYLVT